MTYCTTKRCFGGKDVGPLSSGDKNTRFFHQRASQRRRKNNIDGLHDREETWQTGLDGVSRIAEEYYTELFTSTNPNNMDRVLNVVDKVVTDHMANSLTQPYTEEEVRVALFQMHLSKALDRMICLLSFFLNTSISLGMMFLELFYLFCTLGGI